MQTHRDAVLGPHDPHAFWVVPLEGDGGGKPLQFTPGGGIGKVHLHLQLAGVQIRHQVRISSDPNVELLVDQLRLIALGDILQDDVLHRHLAGGDVGEGERNRGYTGLAPPQGDALGKGDRQGEGRVPQHVAQVNLSQGDGVGQRNVPFGFGDDRHGGRRAAALPRGRDSAGHQARHAGALHRDGAAAGYPD